MYSQNLFNNQLMNNIYYRNYMNQNYYYQMRNKLISNNQNQMNFNFMPYQMYQNSNFNIYKQFPISYQNNILFNNVNKFDNFYSKHNIPNSQYIKANYFNQNNQNNDEFLQINNEETSFEEKKNKNKKKYSIDSNSTNKSDSTLSDEEKDEIEEKEMETLKLNEIENENNCELNETPIIQNNKKGKRRLSNISKVSDFSKCSKSTLNTSICSIKEKDVSEDNNNTNIKENDLTNKKVEEKSNEKYQGNPAFENTEILNVQVKISKDRTAIFKLKRYDDLFLTIKLFCEINSVDEKLIKPLIIKSLSTLNTIYQVMNSKLDDQQINILKKVKNI